MTFNESNLFTVVAMLQFGFISSSLPSICPDPSIRLCVVLYYYITLVFLLTLTYTYVLKSKAK